jgi:hypothetical protein
LIRKRWVEMEQGRKLVRLAGKEKGEGREEGLVATGKPPPV